MQRAFTTRVALAATLALAGCSALQAPPDARALAESELAPVAVPAAWTSGGQAGPVQDRWLHGFGDPQLVALADEAMANNADLRAAATRIDAAAAAVAAAGGNLLPEVSVTGRTSGKATGSSGQLAGVLVSASWEVDLWGRIRYGRQAADDQYASVQADLRAARQSVAGLLAKAWFLHAEALQQQRLAADTTKAAATLVQLAQDRHRVGAGAEVDVAVARANLQSVRDSAAQVDLALQQSRRALEMLLGRYPAAEIAGPSSLAALPPPAATGLPSELLERRPDVIAAERRVAAAFARVGEAGAARLPRLSLTAAVSSLSSSLFVLQSRDDPTAGVGATVFYPLFNGGQLQAQVDLRTADQRQAAAAFAQTAQRAFNEVEAAIASEATLAAREAVLRQGLADSTRALELEQVRWRVGTRDLRTVTQQQLATYATAMSLLRVQTEQRVQRVQLHLALGGDFGDGAPAPAVPAEGSKR